MIDMERREGAVTMKGSPLTLVGNEVKVGDVAPDFTVRDQSLSPVKGSNYRGKVCLISAVPSLDTPVCDTQSRRFNQEATNLGDKVAVLTISADLPFAQKRWCGAAGIDRMEVLSDYYDMSFGQAFGIMIEELRLLARTVFVIGAERKIRYMQLVKEVSEEPDYDAALKALKEVVST